ncbi:hypothetical protein [Paenibacillus solani]|uniref:hypothetical protein n=1 Tax=Paenibacillus solani TaxID=1705565 RepID=UPI003D29A2DF
MKRIQLLANDAIVKWWDDKAKDPKRQEKLRDATEIGLQIQEGKLITIDPEKKKLYDAIETLIESGLLNSGNLVPSLPNQKDLQAAVEPDNQVKKDSKKPNFERIGKLRKQIE